MDQTAPPSPPESVDALFQAIAERAESLPKRLRQCADYHRPQP